MAKIPPRRSSSPASTNFASSRRYRPEKPWKRKSSLKKNSAHWRFARSSVPPPVEPSPEAKSPSVEKSQSRNPREAFDHLFFALLLFRAGCSCDFHQCERTRPRIESGTAEKLLCCSEESPLHFRRFYSESILSNSEESRHDQGAILVRDAG